MSTREEERDLLVNTREIPSALYLYVKKWTAQLAILIQHAVNEVDALRKVWEMETNLNSWLNFQEKNQKYPFQCPSPSLIHVVG
ncbi:hypothetical protein POTOM_024929 [Populus tomentosa]|uniref:Uncharacterized protein n=1 Tax=Populus tomentosa TaxID=118781 RepID=A0A8X7ZIB9_POPTO|nr:hypothetical protein POTOM_024929 [Populus tomentosa]